MAGKKIKVESNASIEWGMTFITRTVWRDNDGEYIVYNGNRVSVREFVADGTGYWFVVD